eukprot:TRINITY_DN81405_c0_g1_i1.p1 TRINITY_DN81405_c0_g1~~TRINITY_DN81405_c0_g1_i1.p1  ORF type:complete len:291 (+),score=45.85 TRINITY_DN81405_c0_g1_i1:3-875(+)
MDRFDRVQVWNRLSQKETSVFMGVPTMYHHLISQYKSTNYIGQQNYADGVQNLRLTVCGSAACPTTVMNDWREISGQYLLERYGMTEIGMALSNPYKGERRPGSVGIPLDGVQCQISQDAQVQEIEGDVTDGWGELVVKGDGVFTEYWNRMKETQESFTKDGFFKTGDVAVVSGSPPYYRIVGRRSADIIKSGGYKVSALEIESVLLQHPSIIECVVVGLPDVVYGERIAVLAVCKDETRPITLQEIMVFCQDFLPMYKIPRVLVVTDSIPRNSMGKVNKKQIVQQFNWV